MISASLAINQAPAYTAVPQIHSWTSAVCACLLPSFCRHSLHVPVEAWPAWAHVGGWLHTVMVYLPTGGHPVWS